MSADDLVVAFEPDHPTRAQELLLFQHSQLPRMVAFVRAIGRGAQELEDVAFAVIAGGSLLDAAEGATLDRWGEMVGEIRGGLGHEDYVRFIDLRIRVNTSHPSDEAVGSVLLAAVSAGPHPSTVEVHVVADGLYYVVVSPVWLDGAVAAHTGALIRDFRPAAIYVAVAERLETGWAEIGTVAVPGSLIGTVAVPGPDIIGRLLYAGRG